jgi:hypothetical protein
MMDNLCKWSDHLLVHAQSFCGFRYPTLHKTAHTTS